LFSFFFFFLFLRGRPGRFSSGRSSWGGGGVNKKVSFAGKAWARGKGAPQSKPQEGRGGGGGGGGKVGGVGRHGVEGVRFRQN